MPLVPRETLLSLAVCVFYGSVSLSLGLLNKSLLSGYNFTCIFILLGLQMALQLVMCAVSRDMMGNPFKIPKYDRATHIASLKLGFAYVANVGIGMLGLSIVNVPMFFCIRRLVSPTILLYDFLFLGKAAEGSVQAAVGTIMLGTLIAGWDTLNSDVVGYAITMLNNLCTAASSIAQKQFADTTKLGALGTLYYTSMTGLPLTIALALVFGEHAQLMAFPHLYDPGFWMGFSISLALGPLLTYSSILCTTYNSPLAMSVTGNTKDVASTIIGAIIFPGFTATVKSVGGLALTFIGAAAYSYINLRKGMAKGEAAKAAGGDSSNNSSSGGAGATAPSAGAIESAAGGALAPSVSSASAAALEEAGGEGESSISLLLKQSTSAPGVRGRT